MSNEQHSLPLKTLGAYGFLAFPLAAAFIALQVIIPTHYAETTSLSLSTIGAIILIARLWDTATDPIVGILSDKTPQRFGRRKIWILASVPFICLSVYALFNPPEGAGSFYLLFWTLAIYISGTMAIVPMNAWGAELSPGYQQRNRITGARAIFGLVGTMTALSIPAILGEAGSSNLENTLEGITILTIITLIIAAGLLLSVPDNKAIHLPAAQFKEALKLIKEPSPFRQLLTSFLSNSAANAIPATLFLFYITYVLQEPLYAGPLLFTYFICAAVSVPFWVKIAAKVGKQTTWYWSIVIACGFFIWTPFLGEGDIWLYLIIVAGTGFTTGCDLIIPSSMNGDLVEWDDAKTGYKRPGLFFALWGTTIKLAYALAIGIAFPLLDLFGFSANASNSPEALQALAWIYGVPCVLLKGLALWNMRGYPVTEDEYERIISQSGSDHSHPSDNAVQVSQQVAK
ncbi:MAG: MFS transporter [Cellvibrionaceae bacterium]